MASMKAQLNGMTTAIAGIPTLAVDCGNGNLKAAGLSGQGVINFPSVFKQLNEYDSVPSRMREGTGAIVEYHGQTFIVGKLAQSQEGHQTVCEAGKAQSIHLFLLAVLANADTSAPVIHKLRILVPDNRPAYLEQYGWNAAAERLQSLGDCKVNGQRISPQIREIEFIPEGAPAFAWAETQGLFEGLRTPNSKSAWVLDIGVGESTFQKFDLDSGLPEAGAAIRLPGTKGLANEIIKRLSPHTAYTPQLSEVLEMLDTQYFDYQSGDRVIDCSQFYQEGRSIWLKQMIGAIAGRLDGRACGVLVVGGGAYHAQSLAQANPRFRVPVEQIHPEAVDLQTLSAYAMAELL